MTEEVIQMQPTPSKEIFPNLEKDFWKAKRNFFRNFLFKICWVILTGKTANFCKTFESVSKSFQRSVPELRGLRKALRQPSSMQDCLTTSLGQESPSSMLTLLQK